MENSHRFFSNPACKYYPCHEGVEELNCLFCFCPFYLREDCPGTPEVIVKGNNRIKDCSACAFPHRPENYDVVIEWLSERKR